MEQREGRVFLPYEQDECVHLEKKITMNFRWENKIGIQWYTKDLTEQQSEKQYLQKLWKNAFQEACKGLKRVCCQQAPHWKLLNWPILEEKTNSMKVLFLLRLSSVLTFTQNVTHRSDWVSDGFGMLTKGVLCFIQLFCFIFLSSKLSVLVNKKKKKKGKENKILKLQHHLPFYDFTFKLDFFIYLN